MPDLDATPEARRLPMRDPDPIRGGGELVENWLRYQGHDAQADKIAALLTELDRLRKALERLASQEGFEGAGWVGGDSFAERELRARGTYATNALAQEPEAHRTKEPSP